MALNSTDAADLVKALADAGCVAAWRSDGTLDVAVLGLTSADDREQAPIELGFLVRAWFAARCRGATGTA